MCENLNGLLHGDTVICESTLLHLTAFMSHGLLVVAVKEAQVGT